MKIVQLINIKDECYNSYKQTIYEIIVYIINK